MNRIQLQPHARTENILLLITASHKNRKHSSVMVGG